MNKRTYIEKLLKLIILNSEGKREENILKKIYEEIPKVLFRYSAFREYSFDVIENNYFYLAPAESMDDQFDCSINFDKCAFIENLEIMLKNEYLPYLKSLIKNKCSKKYRKYFDKIFDVFYDESYLNIEKAKKIILKKTKEINSNELDKVLNFIKDTNQRVLEDPYLKDCLTKLIEQIFQQKENTGLCSLSETNMSQIMWQMYASNYEGFCVEYDMENIDEHLLLSIMPVQYVKTIDNNPIKLLLKVILNVYFNRNFEKEKNSLARAYINILTTKNYEWSFQKEWRVLGEPEKKITAPKIKSIYLGKNISDENKNKVIELSKKLCYNVYIQKDDFENLTFKYLKL